MSGRDPYRYRPTLPALRITLSHSLRHALAAAAEAGNDVRRALSGDILEAAFDAAASAVRGRASSSGSRLRAAFKAAHLAVPYQADQMVQECVGMAVLGAPDRLACAAAHKAAVDALFKRFGDDTLASRRMSVLGATEGPWKERLAIFRAMLESALDAARSVRAGTSRYAAPYTEQEASFDAEKLASTLGVRASRAVRRRTAFDAAAAATLEAAALNPRPPGAADALDGAIAAALPGPARGANPAEAASEVAGMAREGAVARAAETARRITLEALYGAIISGVHRTSHRVLPFASDYYAALRGACGMDHPSNLEAAIMDDLGMDPPPGDSWRRTLKDAYGTVRPTNYLEAGKSYDNVGLRIFYETIHYVAYPAARSTRI